MTSIGLTGVVNDWLATLSTDQRAQAMFRFDDPERSVWAYTPGDRLGLALRDMRPEQRAAALGVVDVTMSVRGARELRDVMALEKILGAIERDEGRSDWLRRDPERYWFAVFGDPGDRGGHTPWMWRVGGHHVAISMTVVDDRVIASAPSFLGANPAIIPNGARAGERTLTGEETLARELVIGLPETARATAIVDPVAPPDILTTNAARADGARVPRGIVHADMPGDAQVRLEALIRYYLGRAPDHIAADEWRRAVADDIAETSFAWAGPLEPGRGHYYAVRGPRFLIEYDNTQNGANHIHAVWRDLANDWGEDLLAAHYRTGHRSPRPG
jgi:hypothetical protein